MKLVIIESPYKGDVERNLRYLRSCIRDCIRRGESPYASHRMLTDALDDNAEGRELGIRAGLAWRRVMWIDEKGELQVVLPIFYVDLGWSDGMREAGELYEKENISCELRSLPSDDSFFVEDRCECGSIKPAGWEQCVSCASGAHT